ncbi:MAG: S41 family peptidase [Bacteroidaceae bacterium]|jgi:carboxyl-terminal processing protease|nr:S41 family peptidase [Bacteroidaceae bacterium]
MSNNINRNNRWVPIIIAVSVIAGIIIGTFFANRFAGNRLNIINTSSNKLNDLLHIIDDQYVDTVDIANIVEQSMPKILEELDPHSSYISAKDAKTANDDLKGSFSGVGIQFVIREDTVRITGIIKGGPSEKVGILAGDKIISVDGKPYVGKEVTNEETLHRLKGEKGTKVKIGILRHGQQKPLSFTVVRGDIPLKSVDATYMINKELGYIKIKNFGETTYAELLTSLAELEVEGFQGLVVDLRGNGGGYLSSAIQMVNEFLPKNRLIVYTQGRRSRREEFRSDGRGSYQDLPIIVLIDETTASAAEIFSGAIQDNDRGIIVGRRSFGKGLVQQPIEFSDGSLIHLTIARYYTPSGRCIQKPYVKGQPKEYEMDLITRYERGEFFSQDSIRQTGEAYKTSIGRTVYGGGGIMPDYFVAEDTVGLTPYYTECVTKGTVAQFCFEYTDNNRDKLQAYTNAADLEKYLRRQGLVDQFIRYADAKGILRRNNMIVKSQHLFEQAIYGSIIYNMLEMSDYVQYLNRDDLTMAKAIQLFKAKQTKPTLNEQTDTPATDSRTKKAAYRRGTWGLQPKHHPLTA